MTGADDCRRSGNTQWRFPAAHPATENTFESAWTVPQKNPFRMFTASENRARWIQIAAIFIGLVVVLGITIWIIAAENPDTWVETPVAPLSKTNP